MSRSGTRKSEESVSDEPLQQQQLIGPIQKLLIVHLRLAELCTGKYLDEGASDEELSEQILYFRVNKHGIDSAAESLTDCYCTQEAIQFAGLCSALYSLPASIDPEEAKDDRTKEVFFDNCSFVFEVLEDPHIVAVAQIARRTPQSHHGGTPMAVGAALRKSHNLFRLLRGGGIHNRLVSTSRANISGCPYDRMDRLYQLRRQKRGASKNAARLSASDKDIENNNSKEIQQELDQLLPQLPISSLREDLRVHYDAFLGDITLLALENSGSCRSIVEMVPAPVALPSGSHAFYSAPAVLSPYSVAPLNLLLRSFLERESVDSGKNHPRVIGISTFVRGQFIMTQTADNRSLDISAETASLLLGYLASFRFSMQKQSENQSNSISSPPKRPFRSLALSFGNDFEEPRRRHEESGKSARFLAAPSLSLLSASDETHGFEGLDETERIWVPPVSLPTKRTSDGGMDCTPSFYPDARICLYDTDDLSFILYISRPSKGEDETSYKEVFKKFDELVTNAPDITNLQQENGDPSAEDSEKILTCRWHEPGQDVIFVDRANHSLTLFSHHIIQDNVKKKSSKASSIFKSYYRSNNHSNDKSSSAGAGDSHLNRSSLGLDCRYFLASHLSLDTLLAFDDAMAELGRKRHDDNGDEGPIELCTFLAHRWIYAYAEKDCELYILFSKQYVTVADVQNAASRIRAQLLSS